ncbi:MAG: hypothetical protein ACFFD4_40285 [Candidatus Odinarchaeota archaeon]
MGSEPVFGKWNVPFWRSNSYTTSATGKIPPSRGDYPFIKTRIIVHVEKG